MTMANDPTASKDAYVLSRGTNQSIRPIAQHWLFKDYFGWNLHPTICATRASNKAIRLADVATGNE